MLPMVISIRVEKTLQRVRDDPNYASGIADFALLRYGEVVREFSVEKEGIVRLVGLGREVRVRSILPLEVGLSVGECDPRDAIF